MSIALTLAGIALASLATAGLLTVVAVGVAEIFRVDAAEPSARLEAARTNEVTVVHTPVPSTGH